ncbi:hypothetical protein ACFVH6_42995 [Spirillospora sp. NPDC127200]
MHSTDRELPDVHFLTSGRVTQAERDSAARALHDALSGVRGEVTSIQVTLSVVADESLPRPALAQAVVVLDGRRVRAQAAAPDLAEAIDLLRERLTVRTAYLRAS